jgi:hypothetical protein
MIAELSRGVGAHVVCSHLSAIKLDEWEVQPGQWAVDLRDALLKPEDGVLLAGVVAGSDCVTELLLQNNRLSSTGAKVRVQFLRQDSNHT